MIRYLLAAVTAACIASTCSAQAQIATGNEFATATPGETVVGIAIGCLNGSNVWVPQTASGTQCPFGGGGGGGSVTQGTTPWVDAISQWGGATVGAATAYGTAPTGNAPGFNAFVTNTVNSNVAQVAGSTVVNGGLTGLLGVGGANANGATATANPIGIGGVFNTTAPTLTTGQRGDLQLSANGYALTVLMGTSTAAITGAGNNLDGVATQSGSSALRSVNYPYLFNGSTLDRQRSDASVTGSALVTLAPSASTTAGVPYSTTGGTLATSKTLKSGAGNLYSYQIAVDTTLSAAPWSLFIFDSTTATGTVAKCFNMVSGTVNYTGAFPNAVGFTTGITMAPSTTACPTYTASTSHAFMSGDVK